jgi:hypothetical protein
MRYRALLIGNSVFDDGSLNRLNAPTKDVSRVHHALIDEATGLFEDENVRLVTDRTSADILDEVYQLFESATKDDLVLLYYSGHGVLDRYDNLYLAGRDTRPDRLLVTGVGNTRVNEIIEQSAVGRTVIVLDCCASGMFKGGRVGRQLAGKGRYLLSSTRKRELANDAATGTGTSLFTEHLVAGLTGKAPDPDGDGFVNLSEIYQYVKTRLEGTTKQLPDCDFPTDPNFPLARVPGSPRPRRATGGFLGGPPFALTESSIVLRDVAPDERLSAEAVDIHQLGEQEIDCYAETSADWIRVDVHGRRVVIDLRPREGPNRAKIVVRDRTSGYAQVLRVEAHVLRRPVAVPSTGAKGGEVRPAPDRPDWPAAPEQPPTGPPGADPARHTPPRPPDAPPDTTRNDPTAVAALVTAVIAALLSCLIVGGPLGVVALVLANQARKRLAQSDGQLSGAGLVTAAQATAWGSIVLSVAVLLLVLFVDTKPA